MQQEFITSKGRIIIERNILYIRNFKIDPDFLFNLLQIILVCAWLLSEMTGVGDDIVSFLSGMGISILLLNIFNSVPIFKFLFKKYHSNRIPLDRITSYEIKEVGNGLENEVILYLKSGRYKSIDFRKLEKEDERFLETISQTIASLQPA